MPAEKSEGDNVWSGTVNLTSTIEVMVTAAASDSLSARIIDAVENAQASKSPVQRFVDRFAASSIRRSSSSSRPPSQSCRAS